MEMELCAALNLAGKHRDFELKVEYEEVEEFDTRGTISPAGYGSEDIYVGTRKNLLDVISAKEVDEEGEGSPVTYELHPSLWTKLETLAADLLNEMY